ncbi:MAG: tetratricopeptide repeat protein [Fimbriimonadaceae bacterium]|nr:tetratricopeptide repeat protein [Fimbriimonadaceae bacterium]
MNLKRTVPFIVTVLTLLAASSVVIAQNSGVPPTQSAPAAAASNRMAPENIDGSRVNRNTQNQASRLIDSYIAAERAGNREGMASAKQGLATLHGSDPLNLGVITWLGYAHLQEGEISEAIKMLELARGKSKVESVNLLNLRNLGSAYYRSEDYAKAIPVLKEVVASSPGDGASFALLGSAQLLSRNPGDAVSSLEKARELATGAARQSITLDLAVAYSQVNRETEALALFEELEKDGETRPAILSWMGYTYLQKNNLDKALPLLQRAADAGDGAALNNLAFGLVKRGTPADRRQAIGIYQQLTESDPQVASHWYNLGTLQLETGDARAAKTSLTRSASLREDSFTFNNLGRAHEALNEIPEAAAAYAKASDLNPSNAPMARNAGVMYLRAGNAILSSRYLDRAQANGDNSGDLILFRVDTLIKEGKYKEASEIMEGMKERMANNQVFWFNLGVIRQNLGNFDGATEAYQKSLEIKSTDLESLNNLGLVQFEKGDFEAAAATFEKLVALNPSSVDGRISLAASLARANKTAAAIEVWRGIVRSNPSRIDVRLDLADALWNTGDTQTARFHYSTVLRSEPDNPRALNGMGLWHLLQAQNRDAERAFRAAIAADRNFVIAYNNLAVVLERQNKIRDAIAILEQALAIKPDFEDAKKNLERLRSLR